MNIRKKERKVSSSVLPIILSVICAICFWLYVMSVESPIYKTTIYGVNVELRNESLMEPSLSILSGRGYSVDVTVTGKKSKLNQLRAEDIVAYADLKSVLTAGEHSLDIRVELDQGITLNEISDKSVLVYADVTNQKTIPVSSDITYHGGVNAEAGYSIGKPYIVPTTAMPDVGFTIISGPASVIATVDHAQVKSIDIGAVNVGSSTGSLVHNDAVLQLVDTDGDIVDNPHIKVSNTNVTVNFPINRETELPVEVVYSKNDNASDYNITVEPSKVRVKGEKSVVNALGKITLNIDGSISAGKKKYPISAEGVEILDGTTEIEVTVKQKPKKNND